MTTAPPELMKARTLLLTHLDMHPGRVAADLDPDEVGIVGGPTHVGGYHCGTDRCDWDDYSVRESPRDRAGFSIFASALDVGEFDVTTPKGRFNLRHFSAWLVGECQRGAPDTVDIREVIYSLDGRTVKRMDRLGKRSTGDNSHLTHTHVSEFRDARGRNMVRLLTRYLIHIGLIGDDMEQTEAIKGAVNRHGTTVGDGLADQQSLRDFWIGTGPAVPGQADKYPLPGSPLDTLVKAAKAVLTGQVGATMTDAQVAALSANLVAAVDRLDDGDLPVIQQALADVLRGGTDATRQS